MKELIELFNDNDTHIEVDTLNQKDNGTTSGADIYSYTVILIDNKTRDNIESVSIRNFDKKDIEFATKILNMARLGR